MQQKLLSDIPKQYFIGLELKKKRGYSNHFCSTGSKVRKYVVGEKDYRGYIKIHERDLKGFAWLLTEKEISSFFDAYNNEV